MLTATSIRSISVHPGLGIARVGNAPGAEEYVLAPEVPGGAARSPDGHWRDPDGRIRRQAAKFRIYATLQDGTVRELTAKEGVTVHWTVELANLKAGWYKFENAMDLPAPFAKDAGRRNADITGQGRQQLDICPGPRTIAGVSASGEEYRFASGTFFGKPVNLGELRTDEAGRLVVLGGSGVAEHRKPGTAPTTFANNDGWHDDVSDGPVFARVEFADGSAIEAEPGYVTVAPPNYAPGLFGIVTMLDVVDDLFAAGASQSPCSFVRDIWPVFQRLTDLQWTNHGIFMLAGFGTELNARDLSVVERLKDKSSENSAFREAVCQLFRPPLPQLFTEAGLPPHYGDYYGEYDDAPGARLALTKTMHGRLLQWAAGEFIDDWQGPPAPADFNALSPTDQALALDRAGLFECLGGPFHPGIELTWCMRLKSVWRMPYRLKVRRGVAPQDFGEKLTPAAYQAAGGPYDGVAAGSLTRFMGVPWQTDEASCLSDLEYAGSTYLSFPSFWGARVPNQVLSEQAWSRVVDPAVAPVQAMKHFGWREDWLRDLRGDYLNKIKEMVAEWPQLGILERTDPTQASSEQGWNFPAWIERGRPAVVTGSNDKLAMVAAVETIRQQDATAGAATLRAAPSHVPPRRRLRRDEV